MSNTSTDVRTEDQKPIQRVRAWLGTDAATRWILVAILLVAGYLRLSHLMWDEGTHIHPDERFLTMVSSALEIPPSLGEFFDSTRSTMSPYNRGYDFFVYGTLPIFIVRVAAEFAEKFNQVAKLWTTGSGAMINMVGYDGVYLVGRALSGLFDLACVWLIFLVARRLYRPKVGLLAAALYACAVLPLQQSHFYTVDTFGTFFALLTFYFAVRVVVGSEPDQRGGGWLNYIALGASLGASVASRINLAPLAAIAVLAAGIRAWDDWQHGKTEGQRGEARWLSTLIQASLFRLLIMGLVTIAVFRIAQPYAFGGTSLLDFTFADKWRSNMRSIQQLISGAQDYPPGHQWANRTPFVFPFVNMVYWGMGLPLGLTAWAGWLVATWQVLRALTLKTGAKLARPHLLPVAWIGGMFLWQGLQYVQSMRYLLPIYPMLAMMAAWLLWWLVDWARSRAARLAGAQAARSQRPWVQPLTSGFRGISYVLLAAVTIGTLLWGWGFLAIYRRPLTRMTASKWIYQNIPQGSVIANEHWDDALPFSIDGKISFKPAGWYYGLTQYDRPVIETGTGQQAIDPITGKPEYYREGQIENYAEDTPEKREKLYQWLNDADCIAMSSNRLWGSIPRLPMRYPMTTLYYDLLFQGKLGFEEALRVTSFPTIFGIQFDDTWAEEAFSVYDHPEVRIYCKTSDYSEALVRSYLDKVDLDNVIGMWPKQVSQAPTALYMSDDTAATQRAGGAWSAIFDLDGLVNRSQVAAAVMWLLLLELLGLVAFPLAFVVLRGLGDRGYGVSKILGVLALAWLSWIGPSLKVVPYERWWIVLCLGLLIGISAAIAWRRRAALARFVRSRGALLLTEEAVFLVLFGLFLLIRIGNPDLWHPARGGEKPMDFAYLNAVIRSTTFPPYDPWHAGGFINYYYFGFVIVGTLIKLTGIVPWVAYNLAVPTLFALTGAGAFSVAFNLADGDRDTEFPGEEAAYGGLRIGSLLAGLAGVFFVAIIGNFGNLKLLVDQLAARATSAFTGGALSKLLAAASGLVAVVSGKAQLDFPNDWWFWNASRVIPDAINEFPFFTFTYADLHAHMIALPLTLLALAATVALVRLAPAPRSNQPAAAIREPSPWCIPLGELLPIVLLGLVLGALRATNTWDFPTYTLAGLAALIVLEAARRSRMPWPSALDERLAFVFRSVVAVLWRAILLLLVATVTFYPYTQNYATAYAGLQAWTEAKTQISDYLTVHGFFLALGLIYLIAEFRSQVRERLLPDWLGQAGPFVLVLGVVLLAGGWALGVRIWLIALPLFILAVLLAFGRDLPAARRLALLLLALALAVTMGVEVIRQKDDIGRMNTVFKFSMQAWVLFGVSTAYGLAGWVSRAATWRPGWRRLALAVTALLFAATLLYPPFAARAKMRDRFSAEASPRGLDGMAYMDRAIYVDNGQDMRLADDKAAMLWLLRNVAGSPVILEGQVVEYRWGSRFSIYTGLPTVQGWNWHQRQQRSVVPQVVERRVSQVQELYNTVDLARARKLLDTYQVSYVIVGALERAYYTAEGLAKFEALVGQGYLQQVYTGGAVTIYEVVGRSSRVQPPVTTTVGPQPAPTPAAELPSAAPLESALPTADAFASPQK